MSKKLKFALHLNNQAIYSLNELRDNFVISEILEFYQRNILQRWLECRSFKQVLQQVIDLNCADSRSLILALAQIFEADISSTEVDNRLLCIDLKQSHEQYLKLIETLEHSSDLNANLASIEAAANHGDTLALLNLGLIYFEGKLVPKNYELAFNRLEQAANQDAVG